MTSKAIGPSVLNYRPPIRASTIVNTNWNHLELKQNISLRTITCSVGMCDRNKSNSEEKTVSVKVHTEMLARQFLSGSFQSQRADHKKTSTTIFVQ